MKTLCVIPARSGSKRLPGKAILPFAGTTLLEITCRQANRIFEDVVFTSDSISYLEMASDYGVRYLRERPAELATDDAATPDVIEDALEWMEEIKGVKYDNVVLLQVTSPLRSDEDIKGAMGDYKGNELVSINKVKFPVEANINGEAAQKNGAIYIYPVSPKSNNWFWTTYEMAAERSIDIDTEFEFQVAEFIYAKLQHLL